MESLYEGLGIFHALNEIKPLNIQTHPTLKTHMHIPSSKDAYCIYVLPSYPSKTLREQELSWPPLWLASWRKE